MELPPSSDGPVKRTVASALPPVAVPIVGAPGTVVAVVEFDRADAGPVPAALVAVTVKVYDEPLLNPPTVKGLAVPLAVWPRHHAARGGTATPSKRPYLRESSRTADGGRSEGAAGIPD